MIPSARSAVAPFVVMEVMEAAARLERQGRRVLHLEVGQPSTSAPRTVLDAAARALRDDVLGYTLATGVPPLRQVIAAHYAKTYGVEVSPDRIVVTTGSSGAFLLAFIAAFDAGARVAVAAPSYPCYRNILQALDVKVVGVPCGPETRYELTPAMLDGLGRIDGVIVASPSNPTGSMIDEETFRALSAWCDASGAVLISDEIYHGVQYGRPAVTAAAVSPRAFVVNSFSKYFSMTGWRVGWMIAPEAMIRPVEKLMQNLFISAPTLAQLAAVAAFDAAEELDGHVARYAANRAIVLDALPRLGIERLAPPDGAFYVYADVSPWTKDSVAFCAELLEATGVAITPGVDFDPERGRSTVRFSYAADTASIAEAMALLKGFVS
ncbi:MAG TPA: aminotransferase class I/II-fold pyridoxal phosphate-dependent enzyme [Caulobacteraceae bacterium]|jgi:aspartate/methionine/tyrosine aminotransferase|nr:aminotransferase class I/II-fold pyridoxal phosphate-dependent enzyme [Caulobacteraceae bacterium]